MIHITYCCPKCNVTSLSKIGAGCPPVFCEACGFEAELPETRPLDDRITRCVICGSTDLFVRKDFPQRLGVAIVVLGLGISCVTWYYRLIVPTFAVLFATALVDLLLYILMGDVIECYRCHAHYRGVDVIENHGNFNLEVHERYRQQAARLGETDRAVGASTSSATDESHRLV